MYTTIITMLHYSTTSTVCVYHYITSSVHNVPHGMYHTMHPLSRYPNTLISWGMSTSGGVLMSTYSGTHYGSNHYHYHDDTYHYMIVHNVLDPLIYHTRKEGVKTWYHNDTPLLWSPITYLQWYRGCPLGTQKRSYPDL